MSAHPFGSAAPSDVRRLSTFIEAVEVYSLARLRVQTYETAKSNHPEAFTMADLAELNERRVAELEAVDALKAQALTLGGYQTLVRCINALEGGV